MNSMRCWDASRKSTAFACHFPPLNFNFLPFRLILGERQYNVPLSNWGSGTQYRTLILLTLFRAKQISGSRASTSKITPVIVIEEPFEHARQIAWPGRGVLTEASK